ncbi:MAG: ROK family protein [Calditrichia bacterium]
MKNSLFAIGIDLGGTAIKYGICSGDGKIVSRFEKPSRADVSAGDILQDLTVAAQEALAQAESSQLNIVAVGIGTPGSVDIHKGYLRSGTPNFKNWKNVAIRNALEKNLGLPVFVDNDANMMAYGEFRFGAGKGADNVVCITLGTGIGGGIIIGKKLFRGTFWAGSEVGHMSIDYAGKKCRCGGTGCWELYASASAMVRNYHSLHPWESPVGAREIFKRYELKEEPAVRVVEEEIAMSAVGLANLVNIFNPHKIIIGGGLSEAGDWFIERITNKVRERAMEDAINSVEIVRAALGNKAGLLGAAALALEYIQNLND